jgi:3-isopropylmalate dehydrogenase
MPMKKTIAILSGDGIGPEIMKQTIRLLTQLLDNDCFTLEPALIGGAAFEVHQNHFPDQTADICRRADAILFGSVGGPIRDAQLAKWKDCETNSILALRKTFGFNVNLRPIKVLAHLASISPLKQEILATGVDLIILRELLGDIYFGEHRQDIKEGKRHASDVAEYDEDQIASIAHQAFQIAQTRHKLVHSVDKANVLSTSKLWRTVVNEVAAKYPDVTLEHMLVDNCAMQIICNPKQFDVILTSNMFGDILSDAAAVIPGSLGLTPSASLNPSGFGLYEPSGGSAPDIAGQNIANPIAQMMSAALMLRLSFNEHEKAQKIEAAIEQTIAQGARTKDIAAPGAPWLTCSEFTDLVINNLALNTRIS